MKRQEELLKKEAEMASKKLEQGAVLNVRRAVQKFRTSTPDTYEANKTELDQALQKDMATLGSQAERLTQEVETAVTQTKERLEKAAEMKKKQEEAKEAENARRVELKEKAVELLGAFEKLVTKAETGAKGTAE